MAKREQVIQGSDNVFADLGLADAAELKAKAGLVHQISIILKARGLKQAEAAEIMGIAQPQVSGLLRGKIEGYSCERLMRFLTELGQDVEIVVKTAPGKKGSVRVSKSA